jgi:2-oxoglutarate dehydrogenase E1 component
MQVVQPTTAAQIFHLLRRQMVRQFRKPLVIFTPKSLLRNKDAGSSLNELAKGAFQTVIGEVDEKVDAGKVKRVVVCSGKVYYDLVNTRKTRGILDTAIVRMEQMYPFPHKAFAAELKKFGNATEVVWAQDEPQNQGPWFQIQHNIFENLEPGQRLAYAGRPASAAPAVGYSDKHAAQQKELLDTAFAKLKGFILTK